MNTVTTANPHARLAGSLYLAIDVCGSFAFFAGYEALFVPQDAQVTAANVLRQETTFRLGIVGDSYSRWGWLFDGI